MDIFLHDLGRRQQMTLLQWRAARLGSQNSGWAAKTGAGPEQSFVSVPAPGPRMPPRRTSWLRRLWERSAGSSPEVAAAGMDALRGPSSGMFWGMNGGAVGFWMPGILMLATGEHVGGLVMLLPGAVMSGIGFWVPGSYLRRVCCPPVSEAEAEALEALMPDELERAYLRLVISAVRQPVLPETAMRVRAALQAIGEAIDRLPPGTMPRAEAGALFAEAAQAQAEAQTEQDAVVAASYERKAEALHRSALAVQRSQTLMRRAAALREEMLAQIESLRLGLAGFDTGSGDVGSLASLADAVRGVAAESMAVTDARAELDGSLAGPPAALTAQAEMIQKLNSQKLNGG